MLIASKNILVLIYSGYIEATVMGEEESHQSDTLTNCVLVDKWKNHIILPVLNFSPEDIILLEKFCPSISNLSE